MVLLMTITLCIRLHCANQSIQKIIIICRIHFHKSGMYFELISFRFKYEPVFFYHSFRLKLNEAVFMADKGQLIIKFYVAKGQNTQSIIYNEVFVQKKM